MFVTNRQCRRRFPILPRYLIQQTARRDHVLLEVSFAGSARQHRIIGMKADRRNRIYLATPIRKYPCKCTARKQSPLSCSTRESSLPDRHSPATAHRRTPKPQIATMKTAARTNLLTSACSRHSKNTAAQVSTVPHANHSAVPLVYNQKGALLEKQNLVNPIISNPLMPEWRAISIKPTVQKHDIAIIRADLCFQIDMESELRYTHPHSRLLSR